MRLKPPMAGRLLTGWAIAHRHRAGDPDRRQLLHRPVERASRRPSAADRQASPAINGGGTSNISSGDVSKNFRTANELHLPVGVPVAGQAPVQRRDPQLLGAQSRGQAGSYSRARHRHSAVPRKTGLFRGQCAEFCGVQHAHMALDVTVESRDDFRKWVAAQQRVAFAPQNPVELAGYRFFHHAQLQHLPCDRRQPGKRDRRPRPDPFRQPPEHRRGNAADESKPMSRHGSPTRKSRNRATTCPGSA